MENTFLMWSFHGRLVSISSRACTDPLGGVGEQLTWGQSCRNNLAHTVKVQNLITAGVKGLPDFARMSHVNVNSHKIGVDIKMLIYSPKMKNTYKNWNMHANMSTVFSSCSPATWKCINHIACRYKIFVSIFTDFSKSFVLYFVLILLVYVTNKCGI